MSLTSIQEICIHGSDKTTTELMKENVTKFLLKNEIFNMLIIGDLLKENVRIYGQFKKLVGDQKEEKIFLTKNDDKYLVSIIFYNGFSWSVADTDPECNFQQVIQFLEQEIEKQAKISNEAPKNLRKAICLNDNVSHPEHKCTLIADKFQNIAQWKINLVQCTLAVLSESKFSAFSSSYDPKAFKNGNDIPYRIIKASAPKGMDDELLDRIMHLYEFPVWMRKTREVALYDITQGEQYYMEALLPTPNKENELSWQMVSGVCISNESPNHTMIRRMCTRPEMQGKGWATKLMFEMCRISVQEKKKLPVLFYESEIAGAIYGKIGFEITGKWNLSYFRLNDLQ